MYFFLPSKEMLQTKQELTYKWCEKVIYIQILLGSLPTGLYHHNYKKQTELAAAKKEVFTNSTKKAYFRKVSLQISL